LGALSSAAEHEFRRDLRLAEEATESGVVPSRSAAARKDWGVWCGFCAVLGQDPFLTTITDKVKVLQVFAHRVRIGLLARNTGGKPVRARTVEDYLRSVGQGFTCVGAPDPRWNAATFQTDFRLYRQLRYYSKQDPPSSRVKPLPLSVLHNVREMAQLHNDAISLAVADLSYIAYFWLLRPGEYCSSSESHPFRLCDTQLFIGNVRISPITCDLADLDRVSFVTLTFTTQKNGVRGEIIGHGRSHHPFACPVITIASRIRYLRLQNAPDEAPLCAVKSLSTSRWCNISSRLITETIRSQSPSSATTSASSLRTSPLAPAEQGGMALLCGRVDTSIIQLVGRWRSDVMLRYLHLQAGALMSTLAQTILQAGSFHLVPGQEVPAAAIPLLIEVPEAFA